MEKRQLPYIIYDIFNIFLIPFFVTLIRSLKMILFELFGSPRDDFCQKIDAVGHF